MSRISRWGPIVAGAVCVLLIIAAFVAAINRSGNASSEATHASRQNTRILNLLSDCLTPGGKCYQRSQTNQANILKIVARQDVYVGLCLHNPDVPKNPDAEIACVDQLIKEYGLG